MRVAGLACYPVGVRALVPMAVVALFAGCGSHARSPAPVPAAGKVVEFVGMCDASGAVPLGPGKFAVADDEDNLLRIYDAARGGEPLAIIDVGAARAGDPEMDLEAATRTTDYALWLGSHGRSKLGAVASTRLRLFVTTAPTTDEPLALVGKPYDGLLGDLVREPRLAEFDLAAAADRAPDVPGGLNIEGMTARPDDGVVIGFRNPIPDGKALLVGLANPVAVGSEHVEPVFDAVHLLDLDGRGVRGLSWWRGRYLVIGGSYAHTVPSVLYLWDGASKTVTRVDVDLAAFNPEALYTPEDNDLVMVLSDDGEVVIDGVLCKRHPNPKRKRFRGMWLALPPA